MVYDVAIIGSGPAGISAAIYAKRGGLSVVVLSNFEGALKKTDKIENYYGFPSVISGEELHKNGLLQAERLSVTTVNCQVTSIEQYGEKSFIIKSTIGETMAKSVIIACGTPTVRPKIQGVEEYEGKGISYCAVCDGFFFRGKSVCILGSGENAAKEAEYLLNLTTRVTVLTNGEKKYSPMPNGVAVSTLKIANFEGNKSLNRVNFEDGSFLPTDGVFVAEGVAGAEDFARRLGLSTDENGAIVTDDNGKTSVSGVFAAGDCTPGMKQICYAVSQGATAGMSVIKFLKQS